MSRISCLNGEFLPHEKCLVHIEDRGFQFADGAYEVTLFKGDKMIDGDAHINRLFRSLNEMKIEHNLQKADLLKMQIDLFAKNNLNEGTCYMQVTRGATNRVPYVPKNLPITISATVSVAKKMTDEEFVKGVSIMTHEDIRWKRCDIKSVALFASSFINQKAKDLGFDDAIFVCDGFVTEGTFANVFMVDEAGNLVTKAPSNLILQGITRNRFIDLAKKISINVVEKDFTVAEMLKAKEVFMSSSSIIIRPVTKINGETIGSGKVGEISTKLKNLYQEFIS